MSNLTRKLAIFTCFLFTGFCFWKAGAGLIGSADTEILPSAQAAMSPSFSPPRVVTTPIQQMRPGMRIVGRNPLRMQTESTIDPTPEGWRLVSVRMLKEDGTYFEAELLRPLSWIHRHQAQRGAVIELNMPELHVVGAAEVLSISACPPIDPGDGPIVLSTFKNVSDNVLNIYVEGETDPIGVTAGHPIWSEDRQAFIHSEKLTIGERLRSAVGKTVRITSIEIRAGPEPVYNLEVAGEHVYSVTDSGLLVHNSGPCYLVPRGYYDSGYIGIVNGSADEFSDTLSATFGTYDVLPSSRLVTQTDTVGAIGLSAPARDGFYNRQSALVAGTNRNLVVVDENITYVVPRLREAGYDVVTPIPGRKDPVIIESLREHGAIFVSNNAKKDFNPVPGVIRTSQKLNKADLEDFILRHLEIMSDNPTLWSKMKHVPASGLNPKLLRRLLRELEEG